jgi:hypothetical protein
MKTLKVHLTYHCSAQCDHCRFRCVREPGPVIEYELLMRCVSDLKALDHLDMVVLMGGEPGLIPDLTHRLAVSITALGVAVRVETNASWATDDEAARRFLTPLYQSGASVMFSLDTWHAPFVPPERVTRAALVSTALGGSFCIESAYLDYPGCERQSQHPRDQHTNQLLAELECALGKLPAQVYRGTILYNGRAAERLSGLVASGRGIPTGTCDQVPWWMDSSVATLDLLELDPDGYLSKGCGIAFANIRQTPIAEILSHYDAARHPVFSTLMTKGPLGLAEEAQAYGYVLKPDYADKCHLCQEAREYLRDKYPEYLVPDQHYRKVV